LYVSKENLQLKRALRWLWYPIVYIIFIIIVGAFTGFYPYPFANVTNLGYPKALLNGVWIVAAFLVLSLIFIGIARSINRKR
ncbi:MAG: Pr6Pr family membrane protein, partial [Chitinophagaceae bacterium]|nr:Pr6Pr family membrane protein [Chitinophagaceae bacterium]